MANLMANQPETCGSPSIGLYTGGKVCLPSGMDTKTAIEKAGGAGALALILGISRQAVYQWPEQVPQARLWQLKVLKPEWFV